MYFIRTVILKSFVPSLPGWSIILSLKLNESLALLPEKSTIATASVTTDTCV